MSGPSMRIGGQCRADRRSTGHQPAGQRGVLPVSFDIVLSILTLRTFC